MKSIFNLEQINFINNNYNKMTYKEMALLPTFKGLSEKQIRNKSLSLGNKKLREFNKRYFKNIDTTNKAYFLGFIYADGYICDNGTSKELGVELKHNDIEVLEKLNQELGGVHEIKRRQKNASFNGYNFKRDSVVIRVYSKDIVDDLVNNKILYNKTNCETYPKIDSDLFWHFLRGFLDGDGNISLNHRNNLVVKFTNSNKPFLEYISKSVFEQIGVEGSIYKEKDKKYNLHFYRKEDAICVLNKIYENKDSFKLKRKYDIYVKNQNGSLSKKCESN